MTEMTFLPSNVPAVFFGGSSFRNAEKEAIAGVLVFLLQHKNDQWEAFSVLELGSLLGKILQNQVPIDAQLVGILKAKSRTIPQILSSLECDGFLTRDGEDEEMMFSLTPQFLDFYRPYARIAA